MNPNLCIKLKHMTDNTLISIDRNKSSNGTYVNNELLQRTVSKPLKNGDIITVGCPKNRYCFMHYDKPVDKKNITIIEQLNEPNSNNNNNKPTKKFKGNEHELNYYSKNNLENSSKTHIGKSSSFTPCDNSSQEPIGSSNEDSRDSSGNTRNNVLEEYEVHELECSCCMELFIKAVTLNCSHSFCKFCIEQWRKNSNICPTCRTNITSVAPNRVLDNCITKVLLTASDEEKKSREKIIEEREKPTEVPNEYDSSDDDEGYYGGYINCFCCGVKEHLPSRCPYT